MATIVADSASAGTTVVVEGGLGHARAPGGARGRGRALPRRRPSRRPSPARRSARCRWGGPPMSSRPPTAARAAQAAWARRPAAERAAIFLRFHDLLIDNAHEVLDLIQLENGKARRHAFEEVLDVAIQARYYAHTAEDFLRPRRRQGALPVLTKTFELHHPRGVIGMISPWNYPLSHPRGRHPRAARRQRGHPQARRADAVRGTVGSRAARRGRPAARPAAGGHWSRLRAGRADHRGDRLPRVHGLDRDRQEGGGKAASQLKEEPRSWAARTRSSSCPTPASAPPRRRLRGIWARGSSASTSSALRARRCL